METDNLKLSEEQGMILETVRRFVTEQVEPHALEWDEHGTFVRPSFDGLAELGMLGIPLPEASGGAEMGLVSFAVALEELGKVCGSSGRLLLSQTALCGMALAGHPRVEAIATGATLGAFVGQDAGITAEPAGDAFVLSGSVAMVTAALEAELFVVAAHAGEEAIVCAVPADLVTRSPIHALGFRASAPGMVAFEQVHVPVDGLAARAQAAVDTLGQVHVAACIGGGALAVGMAEAARRAAATHAGERVAFGKPLARQQAVALKLADSLRTTAAARHLVYHAARLADAGQDARVAGNMARLAAVEAAIFATDEALQIFGGYGFTVEYHVERFYRDAKTLEVFGGGSEALRMELARAVI